MQPYHLAAEYSDVETERSLLATIALDPIRFWAVSDQLSADMFVHEAETWQAVTVACQAEDKPVIPDGWHAALDATVAAHRLADLHQRRLVAQTVETLALQLASDQPARSPRSSSGKRRASRARSVRLLWAACSGASTWLRKSSKTPANAARCASRPASAITGISTGLRSLDHILNGWKPGPVSACRTPGVGKTTFSFQCALDAARQGVPTLYVSYENSPTNLIQKALCSAASANSQEVERGFGDVGVLAKAAQSLQPVLQRVAIVEGARTTILEIRGPRAAGDALPSCRPLLHRHRLSPARGGQPGGVQAFPPQRGCAGRRAARPLHAAAQPRARAGVAEPLCRQILRRHRQRQSRLVERIGRSRIRRRRRHVPGRKRSPRRLSSCPCRRPRRPQEPLRRSGRCPARLPPRHQPVREEAPAMVVGRGSR